MKINKDSLAIRLGFPITIHIWNFTKSVVMGVYFYIFLKNTPITSKFIRFYM